LTPAPKLWYNFGANNPTASRVIKLKNNPALGRVIKNMLGGFSPPFPIKKSDIKNYMIAYFFKLA
jgi:hypothetical protein